MKTTIRRFLIVAIGVCLTAHVHAFTAVTSGAWSNAATWGGVGPGSTVSNQDIIIPVGISVDMDVDVIFNGLVNSFDVEGTLNSTNDHSLYIGQGTFTGGGTVNIGSLTMGSALSSFGATGTISLNMLSNQGATIPLASTVNIFDSLDLSSGTIVLNTNADLVMVSGSSLHRNTGSLSAAGGLFNGTQPYDIYYTGATKTTGIEINSGAIRDVHVMLSSNAEDVVVASALTVNGTLHMATGHISMTGSILTINGEYMGGAGAQFETNNAEIIVNGVAGPLTRDFEFSTGSTLAEFTVNRNLVTVRLASPITITDSLHLLDGTLRLLSGANLILASGTEVDVYDGVIYPTGGTFDGTQLYNVYYSGPTYSGGTELTGSGLNNVTVNLFAAGMIINMDTTNVVVNGNFNLIRGNWNLNDNRLELAGTYDRGVYGEFMGTALSELYLHMTAVANDTIVFDENAPALEELIIEIPAASMVQLGSNVSIHGQVTFVSGKLDVADGQLTIAQAGTIVGNDETMYVVTSGTGSLRRYVTLNTAMVDYPIGTASSYSPAAVQQVDSALSGYVLIRCMNGVYTGGTSGANIAGWESVVNRTWIIQADTNLAYSYDMNVRLFWLTQDEVNGFNRNSAFITHYSNWMWDTDTAEVATAGPFTTYKLTRFDGFNDGGAFAVVDSSVPLGIPTTETNGVNVYPNPSASFVNVSLATSETHVFELYDAAGKLIHTFSNSNAVNQIDMTNYENGVYILKVADANGTPVHTQRIVKY